MSELSDKMRDKWDGITPRERGLVVLLGIAVPTVVIIFLGLKISDGLDARERRISRMRKALIVLSDIRARGGDTKPENDVLAEMTSTPVTLETYVSKAAEKVQITKPNVTPGSTQNQDGFVVHSVRFDVQSVTVIQMKDLLEALETGSRFVVVTSVTINRKFRDEDKDKLDLKLEVSTYSRAPKEGEGDGSGTGAGSS
jgi:type II secretory pathway component PulM